MPQKISVSETGHAKNLENFKKLREFISSWKARYNPTNVNYLLTKVDSIIAAAEAVNGNLIDARAPYRAASSAADDAFDPLNKLVTRVTRGFKAAGVPDSVVEDLMTYSRKVQGRRKSSKTTDDPTTPNVNEAEKGYSAAQTSRTNRIENLDVMITTLEAHPIYDPNEADLKTASLTALSTDLKNRIAAVNATFTAVSNQLNNRDAIFYEDPDSLVKTAQGIKNYVISAFGTDSPEYNQVRSLEFKPIKRRS